MLNGSEWTLKLYRLFDNIVFHLGDVINNITYLPYNCSVYKQSLLDFLVDSRI